MNMTSISDQLPTYPNNIQGELRIILQTKDVFLICYKHLEEYRRLVNEQNRLITKEFVQEQLQIGEDEITELKMELQDAESRLGARLRHNELLADHLAGLGYATLESGASVRHLALCRSPQMRKNMLAQRQGGGSHSDPRPPTHMIDNIALAISEIHNEVRSKVKPLLDYYRDLFYLQLHFSLVLGQVCNYCMPLVTENIGLIDRIFFWSERPEFDLVRRAGDIGDRLKEIYTRAQTVLGVLAESVQFLQSKVELQKTLEQRFHERLDEQQKTKDKILRDVHSTKQNMDMLEEENDRLVGSLVKVDPSFVDSRHFYELAEGGNLLGSKKAGPVKETAQNNAEVVQEMTSNSTPAVVRVDSTPIRGSALVKKKKSQIREVNCRVADSSSPSCIENATEEVNNNKALSCISEPSKILKKKSIMNSEADIPTRDVKAKTVGGGKKSQTKTTSSNINNASQRMVNGDGVEHSRSRHASANATTPTPITNAERKQTRTRSRSKHRDSNRERVKATSAEKSKHRTISADRQAKREKIEKVRRRRPKSTMSDRRSSESSHSYKSKDLNQRRSVTPMLAERDRSSSSISVAAGDSAQRTRAPGGTLKSKLLGRTRDLLEAALHRSPKQNNSLTEPVTRTLGEMDTSVTPERLEPEEINNDAVTSISSFASLLASDSPIMEPRYAAPATFTNTKHLRSIEPHKKIGDAPNSTTKKQHTSKRSKRRAGEIDAQPLPQLNSDVLLIDHGVNSRLQSAGQFGGLTSSSMQYSKGCGKLSDYLAGATSDSLVSSASVHNNLPSLL